MMFAIFAAIIVGYYTYLSVLVRRAVEKPELHGASGYAPDLHQMNLVSSAGSGNFYL